MDPRILALYDEYTHAPLARRVFLERLALLAGGAAAANALLPFLDNNYAVAAMVEPNDARIAVERVRAKVPSGEMLLYVATPRGGPAQRAAVIVIHENRGLNPHIQDMTRRVAVAGYTAVGVDLLAAQGGTPPDEDKARDMFAKVDRAAALADLVAVVDWVAARPDATGKIGAIGFCWGGGISNALATVSPRVAATTTYYGVAPPTAEVAKIRTKLLLHYAGNDARVNATLPEYEGALKASGVDYRIYVYEGVEHAFNNDTSGARYNEAAAKLAWSRTLEFFKATLG
jgi:carboxymethylenebutenolidase